MIELQDTGIVRLIDELGRIVIPVELRRSFKFGPKQPLKIALDGDKVVLTMATSSSKGIIRNVDDLGRIVISMEIRQTLGIKVKDPLEVHVDGDKIVVRKHLVACVICRKTESEVKLIKVKKRPVCDECIADIKRL